ncbi:unnamed protein product, partial [Prorocentrum cordatum]
KQWNYDPMLHATCCILVQYAEWVWDMRMSPSRLQRSRMAIRDRIAGLRRGSLRAGARGQLPALWLTLRRAGWDMFQAAVL